MHKIKNGFIDVDGKKLVAINILFVHTRVINCGERDVCFGWAMFV